MTLKEMDGPFDIKEDSVLWVRLIQTTGPKIVLISLPEQANDYCI
jgi:hypothetical protein